MLFSAKTENFKGTVSTLQERDTTAQLNTKDIDAMIEQAEYVTSDAHKKEYAAWQKEATTLESKPEAERTKEETEQLKNLKTAMKNSDEMQKEAKPVIAKANVMAELKQRVKKQEAGQETGKGTEEAAKSTVSTLQERDTTAEIGKKDIDNMKAQAPNISNSEMQVEAKAVTAKTNMMAELRQSRAARTEPQVQDGPAQAFSKADQKDMKTNAVDPLAASGASRASDVVLGSGKTLQPQSTPQVAVQQQAGKGA